jgi:hypothetical protein
MSSPQSNFDDDGFSESIGNDQDWRVFRYVAGEMSQDQQDAMEAELSEDQSLRESVARMVGGLQLIDSAFVENNELNSDQKVGVAGAIAKPKTVATSGFRKSVLMVTSVVAVLALLMGGSLMIPGSGNGSDVSEEMLAEVWVDSIGLANDFDEHDGELDIVDGEFELMASSWLLDAFDESDGWDEALDDANDEPPLETEKSEANNEEATRA